jgi:hypothetical protein
MGAQDVDQLRETIICGPLRGRPSSYYFDGYDMAAHERTANEVGKAIDPRVQVPATNRDTGAWLHDRSQRDRTRCLQPSAVWRLREKVLLSYT